MKFREKRIDVGGKTGVSGLDVKDLKVLVEPLRNKSGAKTAAMVAELSDVMLELYLSTTRESSRKRAIRRMWEIEEWFTEKS